jgi:hypothetical protein
MAYETRDNSGTLGRNDRATTDKHPSHKGKARIAGVDYWVSAWVKEAGPNSKAPGSKFFSLSFEPCEQQQDIPFNSSQGQAPTAAPYDDDSIPF